MKGVCLINFRNTYIACIGNPLERHLTSNTVSSIILSLEFFQNIFKKFSVK